MDSLKEKSKTLAEELTESHKKSQIIIDKEAQVKDPVVFLKSFFKKKEFKPKRRTFKPPKKIIYKNKYTSQDNKTVNNELDNRIGITCFETQKKKFP